MNTTFASIRTASISDYIQSLTAELERIALTKGLAPIRRVNWAFNPHSNPEVVDEAMNRTSRRI